MTRLLLFIKHRLPFIWEIIEWLNAAMFRVLHRKTLVREADRCFDEFTLENYIFRKLKADDLDALFGLLHRQGDGRLDYFNPHGFDRGSLKRISGNSAFLMFGVFDDENLVGYFFLRCFCNKKCFVGRLIDEPYERKGIGRIMNNILYNTAWRSSFRCFTTVSKDNDLVMRSHSRNPFARVVDELPNDYVLIEFIQKASSTT